MAEKQKTGEQPMNAAEKKKFLAQFPEGLPAWLADKPFAEAVKLMEMRRKAFPKTAK